MLWQWCPAVRTPGVDDTVLLGSDSATRVEPLGAAVCAPPALYAAICSHQVVAIYSREEVRLRLAAVSEGPIDLGVVLFDG